MQQAETLRVVEKVLAEAVLAQVVLAEADLAEAVLAEADLADRVVTPRPRCCQPLELLG